MERQGHIRPIQGGGEGAGFNTPRQILMLELKISTKISQEILQRMFLTSKQRKFSLMKELGRDGRKFGVESWGIDCSC